MCSATSADRDAAPAIARLYASHPHIGRVLPALGYSREQIEDLRATIECCKAQVVVSATPFDLATLIGATTPVVRARYELAEAEGDALGEVLDSFLAARAPPR